MNPSKILTCLFIAIFVFITPAFSQSADAYQMPPKAIADLIDAPPTPSVNLSPDREWMIILDRPGMPGIDDLAAPELRIAGIRIDPQTHARSRRSYLTGMTLQHVHNGKTLEVSGLPQNPKISGIQWSPDGKRFVFTLTGEEQKLWIVDVKSGQARQLMNHPLNSAYGSAYQWMSDSKTLLCQIVPENIGPKPEPAKIPPAPIIQESSGRKAPARTYQDLLQNQQDEALFDYYLTSQIIKLSIDGTLKPLGDPAIYSRSQPSPDGKYILTETIHRPYSYLVPVSRFPSKIEVWNIEGKLVKKVADIPLQEEIPIGFSAVSPEPRNFGWRTDSPATLFWVQALDEGNPRKEAEKRDRVYMHSAPFRGNPAVLIDLEFRYAGIQWGSGNLALVSERWWRTRHTRTWRVFPDQHRKDTVLLIDRSYEDRYSDPGFPVTTTSKYGTSVLHTISGGKALLMSGAGATPEGNKPFLNRFDLETKTSSELWRSQAPWYEQFIALLDDEGSEIITLRENTEKPPNYFIRSVKSGELKQLTAFPHPYPQLIGVQNELITYKREDGVQLSATLYLPAGYKKEDGPLPILMWAYPREFVSADAASQVTGSPYRFTWISAGRPHPWLAMGYAVLDGPAMPIIGEDGVQPNDTFVKQLVANAKAAIDEVVRRGVADPKRIAIGGHSYGAFMTANLLAHSDLFAAGIARSGAYNRTLTPFGFQAEERTFWEAPEIYFAMSPFMHAHKIKTPILLIHGAADNNSGTFPMQSERLYNAMQGHGAITRLVMLPHESHGYSARESIMHVLWETTEWLEKYVKNQ